VVKNTLTERAADEAGTDTLKALLEGPTALTFVHGDAALAAKAIATFARGTDTLAFKGGLLNGETLEPDQITAISRLPARDVLYAQLVGVVASPVTGLVRGLNALIAGLAIQLSQIAEKKESGEIPAGEPPAGMAEAAASEAEAPAEEAEAPAEAAAPEAEAAAPEAEAAAPEAEAPAEEAAAAEAPAETATEPAEAETDTTSENDNEADASA
jgi:large subunit ribosomal protein L10